MSVNDDVCQSLQAANRAYNLFGFSLQVFQAESQRHDFARAEDERMNMHSLLDDYVDNFMAANRRIEHEGR